MNFPPGCDLALSPDCEGILQQGGAVLLAPPEDIQMMDGTIAQRVVKKHWCVPCHEDANAMLDQEVKARYG